MRAWGKLVKFCAHTHTHAAKLVVEIGPTILIGGTITTIQYTIFLFFNLLCFNTTISVVRQPSCYTVLAFQCQYIYVDISLAICFTYYIVLSMKKVNIPYHTIPYHTIPYHTIPCHAMPCHAMPCHAMPCHAMPCHAMPCHAMPSGRSRGGPGGGGGAGPPFGDTKKIKRAPFE